MKHFLAFLLASSLLPFVATADEHPVKAKLLSDSAGFSPGKPLSVGLHLTMQPGWHVYWINPGEAGLATRMEWKPNNDVDIAPMRFPFPERFLVTSVVNFGYHDEVLFPFTVHPRQNAAQTITLEGTAHWLACAEVCIPGHQALTISLTKMDNPTASEARPRFAIALQSIPEKWTETVTARADNNSVQLVLPSEIAVSSTNIFPVDNGWIDLKRAPDIRRTSSTVTVIFQRDPQLPTPKHDPQFVIAPTPGHRPVIVTARLSGAPELLAQDSGGGNVLLILLFAFVGGLILNLMPCVFPVISLKVLSWVQQKRASTTVRIQHGLVYALGILVCFWTLVGVLLALRASGAALGWGFQLQYPPFVVALACLLFLMALILLGILPFGDAFTRVGGRLWSVEGLWGTFFSGILTTVVATPCTAPFLGTAIGFALGSTAAMAWLTFTVIALGLASPYVLLSLRPGALKYLPKPGAWMDRFKQFLAFPLFASVIWLVWVYGQQTSMNHVMHILGTLLLFGFLAWCTASYPKWRTVFVALMVLLAALQVRDAARAKKVSRAEEGMWERFDVEKIADYRKKGRPVFVDFSAAWCLTCQVNEKLVLNTSAIQAEFAKRGVIPMRADWTNNDPVITATLTSLGRNGVPVYALYPANPNAKPVLLPEVLTAAIVVRHLSNQ